MSDVTIEALPGLVRTEPPPRAGEPVLQIRDLHVTFRTEDGPVSAVRGVDMEVRASEVLGIVGESGSGKSVTMLAVLGLLPRTATITGSAKFRGEELLGNFLVGLVPCPFYEPLRNLNSLIFIPLFKFRDCEFFFDDANNLRPSICYKCGEK